MIVKPIPKLHLYDRKQKIEGQKKQICPYKNMFLRTDKGLCPC